jgi:hypothetical protein
MHTLIILINDKLLSMYFPKKNFATLFDIIAYYSLHLFVCSWGIQHCLMPSCHVIFFSGNAKLEHISIFTCFPYTLGQLFCFNPNILGKFFIRMIERAYK